jgi:hypothetical protein
VPRARGRERTPPATPRGRGPTGAPHERSGGSGARRKRRPRADRSAPVLPRSAGCCVRAPDARRENSSTRDPERPNPTIPTRECAGVRPSRRRCHRCSRHAPGGKGEPVAGCGGVGAARGGEASSPRCRRAGSTPERPTARTGCAGARGRVTGTRPRGPPGRPTQVTTREPSERTSRPLEASARPRLKDGDVIDVSEPVEHGSAEPRASRSPRRRGCPTARRCPRAGRARKGASQRARMAARRTRSTPVRLLGDKVDARTLGGPRSPVLASRKVANEVAYWRRTRRRLLTCEAASARPRAGHLGRRPPRRLRRGGACPGRTRRGRHPRLCFVRPGQFRRPRRN